MTQILILAAFVYSSILAAAIYFTRATTRRVLGALAGGWSLRSLAQASKRSPMRGDGGAIRSDDSPVGPLAMYPCWS